MVERSGTIACLEPIQPAVTVQNRLMEEAMAKLTQKDLDKIGYESTGQKIHRTDIKGFFLRCGKATKSWTISIDTRLDGQRKTVTRSIGTYPSMSLKDARVKAMATIAAIRAGTLTSAAPQAQEEPDAPCTLGEAWRSYETALRRKIETGKRSATTLGGYRYLAGTK